ncbi:hypothetical protein MHU86_14541 [Fragilaria crotonensis]|nr:hypothetical protein MHU86_14541 [Fragilaria crotonensis]
MLFFIARDHNWERCGSSGERDPDAVANACVYTDSDDEDGKDYEYCAVLAFLPGAGTLYSHRERRKAETGLQNSFVQLDMSWLRLSRATSESSDTGMDRLAFGLGGYVRKLASMPLQMVDLYPLGKYPGVIITKN